MNDSLQILIDSALANRQVDGTGHCEFILPTVEIDSQFHFNLSVVSASIPCPYNVHAYNNTLGWTGDPYGAFETHAVTIPPGNYSIADLVEEINTLAAPLAVTYNQRTNKLTFTHPTLQFGFYAANNTCFELLGLSSQNHFSTVGRVLGCDNVVNMFSLRSLCVCSNFQSQNIHIHRPHMGSILASIPVNAGPGGIILYENTGKFRVNTFDNTLSELTIRFFDQLGNPVDFAGANWNMLLQLDIFRYVADD